MTVVLPNVRKLFIPDPGYTIFEMDLAGADAQVVAWEADDADLKDAFRKGLDVHSKNAEDIWGSAFTQLEGDKDHGPKRKKRQQCKSAVHGTNYGGTPTTLSRHPAIGWTVHEADRFQKRWFSIHPRIKQWHNRIQSQLNKNKTIVNAFGYRRVYFGRPDECFTEALAWVPQGTVALVTFYGCEQIEENCPWVEMLLQNHDSIVFQIPNSRVGEKKKIYDSALIRIPYPDPLTIPWGMKCSTISWGDCMEVSKSEYR